MSSITTKPHNASFTVTAYGRAWECQEGSHIRMGVSVLVLRSEGQEYVIPYTRHSGLTSVYGLAADVDRLGASLPDGGEALLDALADAVKTLR